MAYDEDSFVTGISIGRALKGWSQTPSVSKDLGVQWTKIRYKFVADEVFEFGFIFDELPIVQVDDAAVLKYGRKLVKVESPVVFANHELKGASD